MSEVQEQLICTPEGWVSLQSRIRWAGHTGIGESRSQTYAIDGEQLDDSGWEPNGLKVTLQ